MQLLRAVPTAGDCGLLQLRGAVTATDDPDDVMKTNTMRRTMRMRRMLMVVRTMMRMVWKEGDDDYEGDDEYEDDDEDRVEF